jgi:hypothetical protein
MQVRPCLPLTDILAIFWQTIHGAVAAAQVGHDEELVQTVTKSDSLKERLPPLEEDLKKYSPNGNTERTLAHSV